MSKPLHQVLGALMLALALLGSSLGRAGEAEWQSQFDTGRAAFQRGDYKGAAARFQNALQEAEQLGERNTRLPATLAWLAEALRFQSRYAEAEPLHRRSLALYEKALGAEHPDVAVSLNNLAVLYQGQGRSAEAESLYRRSLAIREKALGAEHLDVAISLNSLALLYYSEGRYAEAEPFFRRSLAIRERVLGAEHSDVATSLNDLAVLCQVRGRYAEAEPLYRRSLAIREKVLGAQHPDFANSLNNLAALYRDQGRYGEAEPLYRRSLANREQVLGAKHPDFANSLNNLAALYQGQGRYAEAEPLHRRALGIREETLGAEHPSVANSLNNLGALYRDQGRYAEAEPLYRRSLAIVEKVLGAQHPALADPLDNLATLYIRQGRYAEAEPLYRRALAIRERALGAEQPDVGISLNNLARLHERQGRPAEAEPLYRRSIAIFEKALGAEHPDVASSLTNLAGLYRAQNRVIEGLVNARRANAILATRYSNRVATATRGVLSEQRMHSFGFEQHVALLRLDSDQNPEARAANAAEAFTVAQLGRASDTAEQVAKMASRYAAGSDALARLARERQDALARLEQLDSQIVQAAGQRGKEALGTQLHAEEAAVAKAIAALDARLERDYPQYRELTSPKPLELAAAQKLLAKDEALVLMLVSGDESYLWTLRRDDAGFFRLAVKRSELVGLVKKLRRQLDLGAGEPERILAQPFDVAAAHELYRKIVAPAEALLAGAKQLIFIPDAAMQSLPPGVLVTEAPAKPLASLAELAQVPWLAKKYAITVLPAAGSLRALRLFAKTPSSQESFGGFGDPLLEGPGEGARKGNIAALYSRGAVADANEVRKLARLPESAGELRAIAVALRAPASSIRLGAAATERAVKEADLTRYRNLAFATHGLMAGDFKGLAEPALVLTPPEKGSELDDGLLTASEISHLKLDADWVVLSACNTAAPDGTPGAEGLSGLARAFFYAGARSLLVSHWAVSSDAAVAITTRMFDESAKGLPKADALRRSMLALMARADKPYFAHPALWAPFVLVGEGNADWKN